MASHQIPPVRSSRLRMVFDDAVVFCKLATGATLANIAEAWDAATSLHDGDTIAIAVTIDPTPPIVAAWLYPTMSGAVRGGPTAAVVVPAEIVGRKPTRRTTAAARTAIRRQTRAARQPASA